MSDDLSSAPPPAEREVARRRLHTEAVERRGRWPGLVWAIPIAALMVVAYLGIQAIVQRGVNVVVTFKSSAGARAGDTPVIYKGVTVGHVVKIGIGKNATDVDMTLRLDRRAKPYLRTGTKFWLIGAEPSLTDLNSLKGVLSGVTIGVAPGQGLPTDHFIGMDQPPAVLPDQPGRLYVVEGKFVGSTTQGSGVYYHGLEVGRVSRVGILNAQTARLLIFVNAPYDTLVRQDTLFFNAAAAAVTFTGGHVNAFLGPGSSLLTGGIEFDTPATANNEPQSPAKTVFKYFPDEAQAQAQPKGPQVRYRALFKAAAQRPDPDAPVFLSGTRIGEVIDAAVTLPPGATEPVTVVDFALQPESLALDGGVPRASMDRAVRDLLKGGYRLTMGQAPPLVGTATLVFQKVPAARGPAALSGSGDVTTIPTAGSAGLDDITAKANDILAKVDQVPIAEIGTDVRQITDRLKTLVGSPQLTDSLHHLDATLAQVDSMVTEVKPQVGPLVAKLNQAADQLNGAAAAANALLSGQGAGQDASLPDTLRQLNEAARSIRDLTGYLGRHPEAVLKGRQKTP